jgi:anti-sigma factor RsiW
MNCRDAALLLHARLDNELDVAGALTVDRHLSECRACAAQYAALENLQQEIARANLGYALPASLERKLAGRFLSWRPRWSFKTVMLAAAVVAVAALVVSVPMMRTGDNTAAGAEILDSHLRSLQPGHLFDVQSSDQHTVKPWFQGKTDFSPPVPDLTKDGFILVGGRLEVIHRQPAAAIVYQRRQHVIGLYVWPSAGRDTRPELQDQSGYHLLHWNRDNLSFWAVSDVSAADLGVFADLFEAAKPSRH